LTQYLDTIADGGVARGAARRLVDLLGDRHSERTEDRIVEASNLRCRAERDEEPGLDLLANGSRFFRLELGVEAGNLGPAFLRAEEHGVPRRRICHGRACHQFARAAFERVTLLPV